MEIHVNSVWYPSLLYLRLLITMWLYAIHIAHSLKHRKWWRHKSRIEYLIPTHNIMALLLHSNLILKSSLIDRFSMWFDDNSEVAYFLLGHSVYCVYYMHALDVKINTSNPAAVILGNYVSFVKYRPPLLSL